MLCRLNEIFIDIETDAVFSSFNLVNLLAKLKFTGPDWLVGH